MSSKTKMRMAEFVVCTLVSAFCEMSFQVLLWIPVHFKVCPSVLTPEVVSFLVSVSIAPSVLAGFFVTGSMEESGVFGD